MAAAVSANTVTINAAFLQEIKEVNQDLWRLLADVRRMCDSPATIDSAPRRFFGLVEELRDQLALHFALEEAYGYFENPIEVAPRLCRQANELRAEHHELYLMIVDFSETSELLIHPDRVIGTVLAAVKQFQAFDERLKRHESCENELIMQEYGDDIGVGD
ncbi:MAG TPA: hemerythrin domain-containing protein [Pirellulaceae bacterium]|nr:hemerythrin domain-containing protein [Pirellulaceae bacterium]